MPASSVKGRNPKRPRCRTCERPIHVPRGWSKGAATRRHYWARHPEIMRRARAGAR